jgi:Cu(I)/Ag(I) efflux system protein CusF
LTNIASASKQTGTLRTVPFQAKGSKMKSAWLVVAFVAASFALPVTAQTAATPASGSPAVRNATSDLYEGQVRRINKETGRVTLAHGPLTGFNMPAMTMAFAVKDARQLAALKVGDWVKFALEQSGENLVVTRIEVLKRPA